MPKSKLTKLCEWRVSQVIETNKDEDIPNHHYDSIEALAISKIEETFDPNDKEQQLNQLKEAFGRLVEVLYCHQKITAEDVFNICLMNCSGSELLITKSKGVGKFLQIDKDFYMEPE